MVLDTETQIAKILGNCEYYGINVDKNLASQLLIDVKNSQEILQKKAFKLCGYHFNFNSSKDVAKVRKGKLRPKNSAILFHIEHYEKDSTNFKHVKTILEF